jgi:hypothetical protein
MKCYGKEQEILLANANLQAGKAYLPICCLWHSLTTLTFRKWQAGARTGRKMEAIRKEEKERKVFFFKQL